MLGIIPAACPKVPSLNLDELAIHGLVISSAGFVGEPADALCGAGPLLGGGVGLQPVSSVGSGVSDFAARGSPTRSARPRRSSLSGPVHVPVSIEPELCAWIDPADPIVEDLRPRADALHANPSGAQSEGDTADGAGHVDADAAGAAWMSAA